MKENKILIIGGTFETEIKLGYVIPSNSPLHSFSADDIQSLIDIGEIEISGDTLFYKGEQFELDFQEVEGSGDIENFSVQDFEKECVETE